MNPAIQKTISIIVLIIIGYLLKQKIHSKDHLQGIKVLILSIALPATIFVALLKVDIHLNLLYLPVFALLINLALFLLSKHALPIFGIVKNSPQARTLNMLVPSLAPGLSCFPFLMEYASGDSLALAALADVGNKIFVLIILYLLAMHWHFKIQKHEKKSTLSKVKGLIIAMLKEPVNLVIILALVLLNMGYQMEQLPLFFQEPIMKMSVLMTPLVLLFIGMAVKINWKQFQTIGLILLFRSACAFLLSGLGLLLFSSTAPAALLLVIVVFPQSAASFWPFAHISIINETEKEGPKTFDTSLALNFLALSLPFSTVIILSVCSTQQFFIQSKTLFLLGSILMLFCLIPLFTTFLKSKLNPKNLHTEKISN